MVSLKLTFYNLECFQCEMPKVLQISPDAGVEEAQQFFTFAMRLASTFAVAASGKESLQKTRSKAGLPVLKLLTDDVNRLLA